MPDPFRLIGGLTSRGGVVGGAVVRLYLDDSDFNRNLTTSETKTKAASGRMSGALSKFGLTAGDAFAIAGAAAVAFGVVSVKAYSEHQKVITVLQNTIAKMPQLAGANIKAFEAQATALQHLTGFQDEEVLSADTVLARFRLTQTQIQKLVPVILDYARATGQDVTSAAGAVGKALLGNTRALKAVGIEFTATGNKTKDFNAILDLLQGHIGGTAEAFGKTFAGQLEILKADLDDIMESIGKTLLPLLQQLADDLILVTKPLQFVADHFGNLAEIIFKLQTPLLTVLTNIGKGGGSLGLMFDAVADKGRAFGTTMSGLVRPLAHVELGFGSTGVAIHHFSDLTVKEMLDWSRGTRENLNSVQGELGDLANKANLTADDILKAFDRQLRAMSQYQRNWEALLARGLPDSLAKQLQEMGMDGAQIVAALADANKRQFDRIVGDWNAGQHKAGQTSKSITTAWDLARRHIGADMDGIGDNAQRMGDRVVSTGQRIHRAIMQMVADAERAAKAFAGNIIGGFGGGVAPRGAVQNYAHQLVASRWGAGQWGPFASLVSSESGWNPTAQNPTSTAYGLGQFLDSTWASVGGHKTSNPYLQLQYMARYVGQRYGTPGAAWSFHQQHHYYDAGGLITEPVVGLGMRSGQSYSFAEKGPETVSPGKGGPTIVVNFNQPVYGMPDFKRQVVNVLERAQMRAM